MRIRRQAAVRCLQAIGWHLDAQSFSRCLVKKLDLAGLVPNREVVMVAPARELRPQPSLSTVESGSHSIVRCGHPTVDCGNEPTRRWIGVTLAAGEPSTREFRRTEPWGLVFVRTAGSVFVPVAAAGALILWPTGHQTRQFACTPALMASSPVCSAAIQVNVWGSSAGGHVGSAGVWAGVFVAGMLGIAMGWLATRLRAPREKMG